ncbi:MAG TPA: four helix bundle protein [Thermoanaerobaculia bacterium]|nr:four helix bundle protein [Thermoanaerobaculia bacterium]
MNRSVCDRTKAFALRVIHLCSALPRTNVAGVMGRQLLRSGTSVGANSREAFRARSTAEAISKVEIAIQELDETMYWIELLVDAEIISGKRIEPLLGEADELMAILVTSVKTMKRRR